MTEIELPEGYLELHAVVRRLVDEHTQTDALIGELQWVAELSAASLEEFSQGGLRRMANRVDEIREVCWEESGVSRLGRRLLNALRGRLQMPAHLITDPDASGESAPRT